MFLESAARIGQRLTRRDQTVSVAESSTGGLISANLLSVPGASRFYQGGSVVYTLASRRAFLDLDRNRLKSLKPLSEEMVAEFADAARLALGSTWGIAELGAAGPAGTPYGHPPGTSAIGISGPVSVTTLVETGSNDRAQNMMVFTGAALALLEQALGRLD